MASKSEAVLVCMYVCMHVCMYVRNGFTIEIYEFVHSLRTSLARAAHDAIAIEIKFENSEDDSD